MRWLSLSLALLAGCAHAPQYEDAVFAHNMFRQVILSADQVFAPAYQAAATRAMEMHPSDADYRKAMVHYDAFADALIAARNAERLGYTALEQCSDTPTHCDMARIAFACGHDALQAVARAGGQIADTALVFAAASVAAAELGRLADGAVCAGGGK